MSSLAANTVITSLSNPQVQELVRLQRPEERRQRRCFMVEGQRAIDGFVGQGWIPLQWVIRHGEALPDSWPAAPICCLAPAPWRKISTAVSPSGFAAVFAMPEEASAIACLSAQPTLVLVDVSDPGNVGTLLRSALAMAWRQVVMIGGADPYAPKVVQASAGALAALRLLRLPADTDPQALAACAACSSLLALAPRDGIHPALLPLSDAPFLVVGNEAHGLPAQWLAASTVVTLPMAPGVESLNAAMAGSIACWALSPWSRPPPARP